jgi:hypothetical protein
MAASKDLDALQREIDPLWAVYPFLLALSQLGSKPSYSDDAAAAAGGVALNMPYRNGSIMMVRMA